VREAATFFKVLADETRLRMLLLLFEHEELCVCDFMAALEITQSKASRHLGTLRHEGLVDDRKDGLWSRYRLRPARGRLVGQHFEALKATLATRPEAARLLARLRRWLRAKGSGAARTARRTPAAAGTARAARPRAGGHTP